MKRFCLFFILLLLIFISIPSLVFSQSVSTDTIIAAGKQYKASGLHKFLWGSNYRNVWITPVQTKVLWLDTINEGLKPYKTNTENLPKALYLKNAAGDEYLLRVVDKQLGKILPQKFSNTFIEDRVNDAASMANPYAAAATPYLADKANIYHTNPVYVYMPKQPALDAYNDTYGNNLYVLEQNMHNTSVNNRLQNYITTAQLLDTLNDNFNNSVDVKAYIRERLFDMFTGDWNRNETQWEWSMKKTGDTKIFTSVPKDRDEAFSKHNGLLTGIAMKAAGFGYIQSFDDDLKNVNTFNFQEKDLDRRLLNEATLDEWKSEASALQNSLTDEVIVNAVQQLPKEIYPLIGTDIIEKLKARRNHLAEWATDYYNFLAKEVEIPGTFKNEEFTIQQLNNDETLISIFSLNDE
ncbi:MAG: hypothetical protein ABI405_10790, partial [Parafilimonas sp.]